MKYIKKYGMGGLKSLPYQDIFMAGSQLAQASAYDADGAPNVQTIQASKALSGAGTGFAMGNAIAPGIGGLVGGALGLGYGLITGKKEGEQQRKQYGEMIGAQNDMRRKLIQDQNAANLRAFPTMGVQQTSYFAKGGKLPMNTAGVVGGYMKSIAPNVKEIKGRKHEQGGVDIGGAEVEHGEVMSEDRFVFSDRLKVPGSNKTFAGLAKKVASNPSYAQLASSKMRLQSVINNPKANQYQVGSATRNLSKLNDPLDHLFDLQEQLKQTQNIPDMPVAAYGDDLLGKRMKFAMKKLGQQAYPQVMNYANKVGQDFLAGRGQQVSNPDNGTAEVVGSPNTASTLPADQRSPTSTAPIAGAYQSNSMIPGSIDSSKLIAGINKGVGQVAPFIDNLVNAKLTNKSAKIPTPGFTTTPQLNTKYNINPQLAEINRGIGTLNQNLGRNVSDPQTLRANMIAGNLEGVAQKNALYGQKQNIETELNNKQAMLNYENQNRNIAALDNFNAAKFQRTDDIASRISMNAANLSQDLQGRNVDKNMEIRDNQQLALVLAQYQKSGVLDRMDVTGIMQDVQNGMSPQEALIKKRMQKAKVPTTSTLNKPLGQVPIPRPNIPSPMGLMQNGTNQFDYTGAKNYGNVG